MLHALLKGKVRGVFGDAQHEVAWRTVLRASEDVLTAAVFGRLAYLSAEVLWRVVVESAVPKDRLPVTAGRLNSISFWPNWQCEGDQPQSRVQPDVVLSFEELDLIVEAKLPRNMQSPGQWFAEIAGYLSNSDFEGKPFYLLALDGLREPLGEAVIRLEQQVDAPTGVGRIVGSSWKSLFSAIAGISDADRMNDFVIRDLMAVFGFYDMRHPSWVEDLPRVSATLRPVQAASLHTMRKVAKFDWVTESWPFRPIADSSQRTIRRWRYGQRN